MMVGAGRGGGEDVRRGFDRPRRARSFGIRAATAGTLICALVSVLAAASPTAAAGPLVIHVHTAPYTGGVLPSSYLNTYGCHAKAVPVKPWGFGLRTGIGGGADSAAGRACPYTPYRVGSQSIGTANGGMQVSVATPVPKGFHNVTAAVGVNYTAIVNEATGSSGDKCPTTPILTHSGQYYDGTAWSYYPSFSRPISFTSKTYFYYSTTHGASGSCSSFAQIALQVQVVIIASNGAAGYGLANDSLTASPSSAGYRLSASTLNLGAYVSTTNTTSWSCSNYTLWNYGTWSNSTGSCSASNTTATNSWIYSGASTVYSTNRTDTFGGALLLSMSYFGNYSASKTWDVMLFVTASTYAGTSYFPHGAAIATLNVGTLGNAITLRSITVK